MNNLSSSSTHILAATDFSEKADLAVHRAAQIAKSLGKSLHLIFVVRPLEIYPELMLSYDRHVKDYERLKQANGMESLDRLAMDIRNNLDIEVETATRIGRPYIEIANYAKQNDIGLIVTGSRSKDSILDLILGSTSFRLLRAAPCAILIVKNSKVTSYEQVTAAVDLTEGSLHVPAIASAVAPDANLDVLHVFDLGQEVLSRDIGISEEDIKQYRDQALAHIKEEINKVLLELDNKHAVGKVSTGHLLEEIEKHIKMTRADLVVLGKKGKTGFQEFMLGSVSKNVANMADCDVLLT